MGLKHGCRDCRATCTKMCKECNKNKQNCCLQNLKLMLSTAAATFPILNWKILLGIPKPIWLIILVLDGLMQCDVAGLLVNLDLLLQQQQQQQWAGPPLTALRIDKGVVCQVIALTQSLATLTCPSLGEPLPIETDRHLGGNPTPRVDERRCAHDVLTAPPLHRRIIPLRLPHSIPYSLSHISLSPSAHLNGWVPSLWSLRSLVDRWMCRYANGLEKKYFHPPPTSIPLWRWSAYALCACARFPSVTFVCLTSCPGSWTPPTITATAVWQVVRALIVSLFLQSLRSCVFSIYCL